jgi:hypothetical protein
MSIHQPRYSIFKLLDTLTLLSAGNVVYHGQASNALEYFNGAGRNIEVTFSSFIHSIACFSMVGFDGAQVFVVKSMIIQLTSSWMLSLPAKGREVMKVTVDFKIDPDIIMILELDFIIFV